MSVCHSSMNEWGRWCPRSLCQGEVGRGVSSDARVRLHLGLGRDFLEILRHIAVPLRSQDRHISRTPSIVCLRQGLDKGIARPFQHEGFIGCMLEIRCAHAGSFGIEVSTFHSHSRVCFVATLLCCWCSASKIIPAVHVSSLQMLCHS